MEEKYSLALEEEDWLIFFTQWQRHVSQLSSDPSLLGSTQREGGAGRGARRSKERPLPGGRQQHAWERRRREGSLVAGGGMLERCRGGRTGGARGGWKQLAVVVAEAGSKWNEMGAGRGTKPMKNP
jgi:hypothetical protein